MLTVDKFLCFTLETGGLFIGWLNLVVSVILAILVIIGLVFVGIMDCDAIAQSFGASGDTEGCSTARGIFIGAFVFVLAFCIVFAVIAHKCIKGTKDRNHLQVKPMMILLGICAVLSILNIFTFTAKGISSGIFSAIINTYFFIVIYSLYTELRLERERVNANKQYQPPALKV